MEFKTSPKRLKEGKVQNEGFTLSEVLVTTAIIAGLSSIAIPTYVNQKKAACQRYPENAISQAMLQAQAYQDEYKVPAKGWSELNKIATLMTTSGPAEGSSFSPIDLPECGYTLSGSLTGSTYTFQATDKEAFSAETDQESYPIDPLKNGYNVVGCLNTTTGASDIRSGNGTTAASTSNLACT